MERKELLLKTKGVIVQFNENHEWCGCLGIIEEVEERDADVGLMIGVPVPMQGIAYIYVMDSENALEFIDYAKLVPKAPEEDE